METKLYEKGMNLQHLSKVTIIQNSHGDVKHSIGNGVAKEHISMTHGHEQW